MAKIDTHFRRESGESSGGKSPPLGWFRKPHYDVQAAFGIPQGDTPRPEPSDPDYLMEKLGEGEYRRRYPSRFDPYPCEQTAYVSLLWCIPHFSDELTHCLMLPTHARGCIGFYEVLRKQLEGVVLLGGRRSR